MGNPFKQPKAPKPPEPMPIPTPQEIDTAAIARASADNRRRRRGRNSLIIGDPAIATGSATTARGSGLSI